jgi:pimeloyl-ACP methyl ester carboxylesterase
LKVDVGRGIELEVEVQGQGEPLVLLMGLGRQLIHWPQALVDALAGAGFQVIRCDNRDVGLSTHMSDLPVPDLRRSAARRLLGLRVSAPYGLADMADDVAGLLDGLGVQRAHVMGPSLGGMVAQVFALRHPTRALSLTSLMSTPAVRPRYFGLRAARSLIRGSPRTRDEYAAHTVDVFRTIGSPTLPRDDEGVAELARQAWDRNPDTRGFARQVAAALAAPARDEALRGVRCPALVLHGERDPLILPRAGRATARAIPGARFHLVPEMGHELHPACFPVFVEEVSALAQRARVHRRPPQ